MKNVRNAFSILFLLLLALVRLQAQSYERGNMFITELQEPVDVTNRILNPSFETGGLANWTNDGMQSQTNDSPTSQGWQKNGSVYAEKWVADSGTLPNASLSQKLSGLPAGKYLFKALAHAVNQSGTPAVIKGAFLYAGMYETLVTSGKEYTVEATVADGTLEIGFKTVNTTANWVAFDHTRLYYCGRNVEIFQELLDRKLVVAVADTLSTNRPGYFNILQYREAIEAAKHVEPTEEAVLAAILALDAAASEATQIRETYALLKEAITNLTKELKATPSYPDKAYVEAMIASAQAMYDDPNDQRSLIQTSIAALAAQSETLSQYMYLGRDLRNAKRLLSSSEYPDKTLFSAAIEAAQEAYNDPSGKDLMLSINALSAATTLYLNGRPSNWATIKNGAMWKDNRGSAVQAHGAGFVQVGDTWYMIGEDRSNSWNPDVNMYSTKDFVNWKFERKIIQNGVTHSSLGSSRFIERPKIMYNKKTGKFVVWCHWEQSNYGASEAAVFYCDSVNGPYKFHWAGRPMGVKSRDCTAFVDDDGTAYFISTTEENQHLGLFKLSDDYLSVVEHTQLFSWQSREAPAVVRIGDTYFMLFSACSGWDPNQASYSYSKSLKSGWSNRSNIGNPWSYDTQAASILKLQGSKGTTYIYVGDRWQDPGLPESKTILFPLTFSGNSVNFSYKQQFDLDLATGTYRETDTEKTRVPKKDWKVRAFSSQETSSESGAASNAIDGNPNTKWHTKYSGSTSPAPHFIEVDMGAEYEISGFLAMPRLDNSTNGTIREYLFLVSKDGEEWETVSGGSWMPYAAEVYFTPTRARYFRMVALSGTHACITELDVLTEVRQYTPYTITPNYQTGTSSSWMNSNQVKVKEGLRLKFGPNQSAKGTWAFSGPNSHAAATREYEIAKTTAADAGTYTSVFLDIYSQSSKKDYYVTVTDLTSIEGTTSDEKTEVDKKYYDLQGMELASPEWNQAYILKRFFDDGSVEIEKELNQNP